MRRAPAAVPSIPRLILAALALTCILFVGLLGTTRSVRANGGTGLIHVLCMPEIGMFKFTGLPVSGDRALNATKEMPDALTAKYGLYDQARYIDFVEATNTRSGVRQIASRKESIRCDLEGNVVDLVFEPDWLGTVLSTRLTVRIDGRLVLDDLRLHDDGRDANSIDSFAFFVGNKYFELDGSLGPELRPYLATYFVSKSFDFGSGIPPLREFNSAFEQLVDGLEPPPRQRRRRPRQ